MLHENITSKILQAFFIVYNTLGHGFLEKVYENAVMLELNNLGLSAERQKSLKVFYHDIQVGDYFADIIVKNAVIIELKAIGSLREEHEAQLINYLKATEIEVGILLNFGKKAEFRRKIFSNGRKKNNQFFR